MKIENVWTRVIGIGALATAAAACGSQGSGAPDQTGGVADAGPPESSSPAGSSGSSSGSSSGGSGGVGAGSGSSSGSSSSSGSGAGSGSGSGPSGPSGSGGGADGGPGAHADGGSSRDAGSTHGPDATAPAGDSGAPLQPPFMLGADITFTQQDQAGGATFVDQGTTKPILQLLRDHGFNYVRLRTFVDPTQSAPNPAGGTFAPYSTQGFADLAHTITFGQAIKAAGMGFLLDFHFSDTWADPGKQVKPATWVGDDLATITTALHDYAKADVSALVAAGARPDMVQIGNEITPGLLLSPGTAMGPTSNWKQLAQLLDAGIAGVHEVDPSIRIMLHIDRGGDLPTSMAWIQNAMANGVKFDVFGESCYLAFQGQPSGWQNTFTALAKAFPGLQFVIAEYNSDSADQTTTELRTANDVVHDLPNHQGAGTFIWEPTHSGSWGPGLFTLGKNVYTAVPGCMSQYDQMKTDYGL